MKILEFTYKSVTYKGYSQGGVCTSIIVPAWNAMFDMGNTNPDQVQIDRLFITHPHLDHFSGVPYYVSQRSLRRLPPPEIYVPEVYGEKIQKLLQFYAELEDFPYSYNLIPAEIGKKYPIQNNLYVMPLQTYHRVTSQGYTVFETKHKLKDEFKNLTPKKLVEYKEKGEEIEYIVEAPIFSFSGDTMIEYVLNHEAVQKSRILFIECTYICEKRDVKRARDWGHIHLDEIAANADFFKNEKIVLIHFSPRYPLKQIKETVKNKLPEYLYSKVHLFIPDKSYNKF